MNRKYDLLIAGGGPAGLSAAYTAALGGLRVAVFERSKEVGYPIHSSGGSWIAEIRALGIPERYMHPVHTGRFVARAEEAVFSYEKPVSCILDVRGLYQYLAVTAAKAGAEILPASHVEKVFFKKSLPAGLEVHGQGQYFAPLVIDASGMAGVLARQAGLSQECGRYGLGAEVDVVAPQWPQGTIALLFGSLAAPSGYGWIFPHGEERVRIGIGVIRPDTQADPKAHLHALLQRPPAQISEHLPMKTAAIIETHTGAIPSAPPLLKTSSDGLLVVGDAGGLISTLLGEGIRFAIELGRLAGEVAREAHQAGRFDGRFLSRFDRAWRTRYGRMFTWAEAANRRIARYDDEQWAGKIRLLRNLPAEVIPALLKGNWLEAGLFKTLWHASRKSSGEPKAKV
ncbi:MAG: NAD(P)/FAD-dependent oxidoreductase [bacterium]